MASIGTITITLDALCPANNHVLLTLNLNNGEKIKVINSEANELVGSGLEEDDIESFLRVLLKLGMRGRTKAQVLSLLQDGVIVDIDAVPA